MSGTPRTRVAARLAAVRRAAMAVALTATLSATLALAGCGPNHNGATSGSATAGTASGRATQTAPAGQLGATRAATGQDTHATPGATPGVAASDAVASPSPDAAAQAVAAAIKRAADLGAGGQVVSTSIVTDLGSGPSGMCQRTAIQTNADGDPLAAEVSAGIPASTDLATQCGDFTATAHYVAIGADAYVEVPSTSGTYQHVLISPDVLKDLSSTAARNQVGQFESMLAQASSVTSQGNGAYQFTFDAIAVVKRAAAYVGLSQEQVDAASTGTVTLTYQLGTTTGLVDSVTLAATITGGDSTATAQALTSAAWTLDNPITAPATITPGDPVTVGSFDELSQIALGTTPAS